MVTTATVEAYSVKEAAAKVDEIYKIFGSDVEIDLSILAGDAGDEENSAGLGYSFTWLKNKQGKQEETNMVGAIEFNVITDMTKLPQKVASAASAIETAGLVGASYKPIVFCGTQLVRGTNYLFIAEQTLVTATPTKRVVSLKVNEFQGKFELVKDSIKVIFG